MRAYVIRRILLVIPTLFIVTVLVFLSVRFIPGDIIDVMTARMTATQSGTINEEALKRRLGLDKPVYAQYAKWIGDIVLRGTLGRSLYASSLGSATVEEKLAGRVGVTVEFGAAGDPYRGHHRRADRDLLGDSPVHGGGLRRPDGRHLRPGDSQLLAGTDGDDLPGHLVGLDTAADLRRIHRRPLGQSEYTHHPRADPGDLSGSEHHAHDTHDDAGGAAPGLREDRLGQGP